MTTYILIILLFCLPLAIEFFAKEIYPLHPLTQSIEWVGVTSPFSATFAVPLEMDQIGNRNVEVDPGNWLLVLGYLGFAALWNGLLLVLMIWLFRVRWRVSLT
jgi:hypothetical protein